MAMWREGECMNLEEAVAELDGGDAELHWMRVCKLQVLALAAIRGAQLRPRYQVTRCRCKCRGWRK
jgi:hypothetical protein